MSLPKKLFVVERKERDGSIWFNASRNKFTAIEEDGEIVGTYVLENKERGKQLVEFTKVK